MVIDNMQLFILLAGSALAATASAARSPLHVGKDLPQVKAPLVERQTPPGYGGSSYNSTIIPQNANTTKYSINGSAIPDVDFNVGESYAGLMPISSQANSSKLYFWFFPSENELASDEILIWLNGGPGCSSLEGLLQENGPFLWQYGTYRPVKNPYTWVGQRCPRAALYGNLRSKSTREQFSRLGECHAD